MIAEWTLSDTLTDVDYMCRSVTGNDVCNGHPGMGYMTTVPEFTANVLTALDYLVSPHLLLSMPACALLTDTSLHVDVVFALLVIQDTQLPAGSHVMFVPLADGLLLWEILHNRTHPIGVSYPDLYDYLICMGKVGTSSTAGSIEADCATCPLCSAVVMR